MEVVVISGAIRRAKLRSNRHHQQTNTRLFYSLDALPVAQPKVSEHLMKNVELMRLNGTIELHIVSVCGAISAVAATVTACRPHYSSCNATISELELTIASAVRFALSLDNLQSAAVPHFITANVVQLI